MTASIVVNTFNRASCLERLLASLARLEGTSFEVVVVNGPSTDHTAEVLAGYADRIKVASCDTANLSRSRNIGIAAAAGDVVVFIDDDALPASTEWLQRLVAVFETDPTGRIGAAGGPSIHRDTDWTEFDGGWTSDYAEQHFTDRPDHDELDPRRWCRRTVGNNTAFRRTSLVEVGGFDENFPYYLDEADVCLRLVRAGYEVVHVEDAAVRHYPAASPLGEPFIRNRRLIARSDAYYCLKNGADLLPLRVFKTLRRAPRKHFVSELQSLVDEGRISREDLARLRRQILRGTLQGLALGLFGRRAARLDASAPPPFVPFGTNPSDSQSRPLSIALLSRRIPPDPHAGGVGRYTYDLACGLHDLGHRVTILTESDVPVRRERLGFEVAGITPGAPSRLFGQSPVLAQNLAYAEAVLRWLQAKGEAGVRFDVVHASNWGLESAGVAQYGAWPLVLMLVTPLERVIEAEGWSLTQDLSANIELDQWTIEHATRVLAPSAGVLDSYGSRASWSGRSVNSVALGTLPAPGIAGRPEGKPFGRRRLLFVGRLERRKGIHLLLEALPALLERHPDWQCDLVGNKTLLSNPGATFEAEFRERHAGAAWIDRVAFHGAVSDDALQSFYRAADVFVAPSLYESFGLIYLEAMQHGVPVVGCRTGGVPDVVTHEQDGLLVPPGDAEALGSALDRLMSDETLRTSLGARAAESVRTSRGHRAMAERMVVQYREAIDAHAATVDERADRSLEPGAAAERPLVDHAMAVLESCAATRGVGLACRASAAFEQGNRNDASELIAQALGVAAHPDYYAFAVELALVDQDAARAREFAVRGFEATGDGTDACLVFAATLLAARDATAADTSDPASLADWLKTHEARLPERLLACAVAAIRSRRDGTALMLLGLARDRAAADRRILAQVLYHLGSTLKRNGRAAEARACLEIVLTKPAFSLLPEALQAAAHFHVGDLDLLEHQPAAAIPHFEACLSLNPGHARARVLLEEASEAAAHAA